MKKSLSMLLVCCLLVAVLSGCGNKSTDDPQGETVTGNVTQESNEGESAEVVEEMEPIEPITFEIYTAVNTWDEWKSPVSQKITELTGVTVDMIIETNDPEQREALMLAGGDLPDIIHTKNLSLWVDAGELLPLEDLINEHAPNLKAFLGDDMNKLKYADGHIYTINGERGKLDPPGQYWNTAFFLQHELLKELGYPEIKSIYDFEKAISDYIAKYPEINGQPTIGLTLATSDGFRHLFSLLNPASAAIGLAPDGDFIVDEKTLTGTFKYSTAEMKEYFKWLNHMYDIGLLDKESFTQTYDQYLSKISSGRVLGLADGYWHFMGAIDNLKNNDMGNRIYAPFPALVDPDTMVYKEKQSEGEVGGTWGLSITSGCEDPVRAIKFIDFLVSEEGAILINNGIEGVHYDVIDGVRVRKEEFVAKYREDVMAFTKETGIEATFNSFMYPRYGYAAVDSNGQPYRWFDKETVVAAYSDMEKETFEAYGAETYIDMIPKATDFEPRDWGNANNIKIDTEEDLRVIKSDINQYIFLGVVKAILADPADFDAEWDAFLQEVDRLGLEQLNEKFNEELQKLMQAWQ